MRLRPFLSMLFLAALSAPAEAHSPIAGIGAFYNGMLHPLLVPLHLLCLVSLGLLMGQYAPRASRFALPVFALATVVSLLAASRFAAPVPQAVFALLAAVTGLLVATALSRGAGFAVMLAAAAGILVGVDSAPEGVPAQQAWLALAGTGLGGFLAVTYIGGLAAALVRPWQKIAVRVAGSWVAASAILILTLTLVSPNLPA